MKRRGCLGRRAELGTAPWMMRSGASPNTIICRLCESESKWHLKPFSSRHCFLEGGLVVSRCPKKMLVCGAETLVHR